MKYLEAIHLAQSKPKDLEELYQEARSDGGMAEFSDDLIACYHEAPENLLYAAWYFRLERDREQAQKPASADRAALWRKAVPLAVLSGLVIGLIAALGPDTFLSQIPLFFIVWAPVAGLFAIAFILLSSSPALGTKTWLRNAGLPIGLLVLGTAYVIGIATTMTPHHANSYLEQMLFHLPLLTWIAIGLAVLGLRAIIRDRFAFLIKSIDVAITAGLYLIAGVAFGGITIGMLEALNINLPDTWMKLMIGGGFGLIPIIALVSAYDPRLPPSQQDFNQGLSKFAANMMRLLLPLTLLVLVVYVVLIPFNFAEPFQNRDLLIVYNLMLFAIMGLILGAIPIAADEVSPRLRAALRTGILAVASLAILVSFYAFSAILYRTFTDVLTMNRLMIIGWNLINIAILGVLVYRMGRAKKDEWVEAAQAVYSRSILAYVVWCLFIILVIPLIFR